MSKQKRHKPEEIASILKQYEAGLTTAEVCLQYNISSQTLYRWKSKCGGMGTPEFKAWLIANWRALAKRGEALRSQKLELISDVVALRGCRNHVLVAEPV